MRRVFQGLQGTDRQHADTAVCVAAEAIKELASVHKSAQAGDNESSCTSAFRAFSHADFLADRARAQYESIERPTQGQAAKILAARHYDCDRPAKSQWTPPSARGLKLIQSLGRLRLRALDAVEACYLRAAAKAVTEEL